MIWPSLVLIFAAGLLVGLLFFPVLNRAFFTPGVQSLFRTIRRAASARALGGEVILQEAGHQLSDSVLQRIDPREAIDPREQQISDSAQAVRSVLLILTAVIDHTEQAASESSEALKTLRESFDRAGLPAEVAAVTSLLTEQIDRMISSNVSLKGKLTGAQKLLSAQQQQIDMLRTAVLVDGMTQLSNRSYFDDKLLEMIRLRQRYHEPFFLVLLDVDNFKGINDTYGHQAGDCILRGVSAKLRSAVRESDFLARYGGDEFALILIKCTAQAAHEVAKKLCNIIRVSSFPSDGVDLRVTLSIGAAEATEFDTPQTLLERADAALYRVKESGRNGVDFAESPVEMVALPHATTLPGSPPLS